MMSGKQKGPWQFELKCRVFWGFCSLRHGPMAMSDVLTLDALTFGFDN
jgi:hypothetical protein